ncbi:zf-HC2 domain-containing protein [bacterium]|nr:zf-HC2 domain-containing protein [bacterium]
MLSCKKASILLSASMDRELTFFEKFRLNIHLAVCKWCRRFRVQLVFLQSLGEDLKQDDELLASLPQEAKERIQNRLNEELNS